MKRQQTEGRTMMDAIRTLGRVMLGTGLVLIAGVQEVMAQPDLPDPPEVGSGVPLGGLELAATAAIAVTAYLAYRHNKNGAE